MNQADEGQIKAEEEHNDSYEKEEIDQETMYFSMEKFNLLRGDNEDDNNERSDASFSESETLPPKFKENFDTIMTLLGSLKSDVKTKDEEN